MGEESFFLKICTRRVLFFLNVFIVGLGIVLIAGQGVSICQFSSLIEDLETKDISFLVAFLVITILNQFIGILGIISGAQERQLFVLKTYIVTMILILMSTLAMGCVFLVQGGNVKLHRKVFTGLFRKSMRKYDNKEAARLFVDLIQTNFDCCGSKNANDWNNNRISVTIPKSCCRTDNDCNVTITENIYFDGCGIKYQEFLALVYKGIGGASMVAVFIQFMCVSCAFGILIGDSAIIQGNFLLLQPLKDQCLSQDQQEANYEVDLNI